MAHGAAFLNPRFARPLPPRAITVRGYGLIHTNTQHDAISLLSDGAPYTYTVDFRRPETVVAAALRSSTDRFSSYVPYELTGDRVRQRVCALLKWDRWPSAWNYNDSNETLNPKHIRNYDQGDFTESGPLSLEQAMIEY